MELCPICNGEKWGVVVCKVCEGKGTIDGKICRNCRGVRELRTPCRLCAGFGKVSEYVWSITTKKKYTLRGVIQHEYIKCEICSGVGAILKSCNCSAIPNYFCLKCSSIGCYVETCQICKGIGVMGTDWIDCIVGNGE